MSRNSNQTWNTKYGPRRVRHEAPTLEEAIVVAQGLSDKLNEQAKIAAALIGLPYDQVRAELLKVTPPRKDVIKSVVFAVDLGAAHHHGRAQTGPPRDLGGRSHTLSVSALSTSCLLGRPMDDLPKSSNRPSSVCSSWLFTRQSAVRTGLQARRMTRGSILPFPGADHSGSAGDSPRTSKRPRARRRPSAAWGIRHPCSETYRP